MSSCCQCHILTHRHVLDMLSSCSFILASSVLVSSACCFSSLVKSLSLTLSSFLMCVMRAFFDWMMVSHALRCS